MHITCLSLLIESTDKFDKTPTGSDDEKNSSEVKNWRNRNRR